MTYVTFSSCLRRAKNKYQLERDARYGVTKRAASDEEEGEDQAIGGVFDNDDDSRRRGSGARQRRGRLLINS